MNILINFFSSVYDLTITLFASLYDLIYNFISFLVEYVKWVTNIGSSNSVKSVNSNTQAEEALQVQNQKPVEVQ